MTSSPGQNTLGSPERSLRWLFLTLFLRGRSARGLFGRRNTPGSVGSRLSLTLAMYAIVGTIVAVPFIHGTVLTLALYLHGMTLIFCGMFIAASAGETLFNKDEADILLHRPITPQTLLRAKLRVLLEVSLWIAGAFNLGGFVVGIWARDGGWLFPPVHAISTVLEALFCTSCVVLGYEICLRSFGRERLENVMTAVQVLMAVAVVGAGQLVPRMIGRFGVHAAVNGDQWWMYLFPPAWFASFDEALASGGGLRAWTLAAAGVAVTAIVVWLALNRMARHYVTGLQTLGEAPPANPARSSRRPLLATLVHMPPFSWALRDPVRRASFLLVSRYVVRDRDVKLRLYPGLAPMLVVPVVMLLPDRTGNALGTFGVALAGSYLGMIPLFALNLLQYSQQWLAADVFRVAPIAGPARLCAGARLAVSYFITIPFALAFGAIVWLLHGDPSSLYLLAPGLIVLPVFTLYSHLGGQGVPLSVAGEEARSAGRGVKFMLVMFVSFGLSGVAWWSWSVGWLRWFLLAEALVVAIVYTVMRASLAKARWSPAE